MTTLNFESENNDTWLTATEIELSALVTVGGQIAADPGVTPAQTHDIDWYKFQVTELNETQSLDWSFSTPATSSDELENNFRLRIFYESDVTNESSVVASQWTDSGFSDQTFHLRGTGWYYVKVENGGVYSFDEKQDRPYGLNIRESDQYAEIENNDPATAGVANSAKFGRVFAGQLSTINDVDVYSYQVISPGLVTLAFTSPDNSEVSDEAFYQIMVRDSDGLLISSFFTDSSISAFDFLASKTGDYSVTIRAGTAFYDDEYLLQLQSAQNNTGGSDGELAPLKITGSASNDNISGSSGDEVIDGGLGADAMYGGSGNDLYVVDNNKDRVFEYSDGGTDVVESSVNVSKLYLNIEKLVLKGGALIGRGNSESNTIFGNELANKLYGFDGDDVLDGGVGMDYLSGGRGDDTYYIDDPKDRVSEGGNSGTDLIVSSIDLLKLAANVENVTLVGEAVQLYGNNLSNALYGNDGFNKILGLAGNDMIYGLGGNDDLRGGLGSDTLIGGDGEDTFAFDTKLGANNVDSIDDFSVGSDKVWLSKKIFSTLDLGPIDEGCFLGSPGVAQAQDSDDYLIYNQSTGELFFDADGSGVKVAVLFAVIDGANQSSFSAADIFVY